MTTGQSPHRSRSGYAALVAASIVLAACGGTDSGDDATERPSGTAATTDSAISVLESTDTSPATTEPTQNAPDATTPVITGDASEDAESEGDDPDRDDDTNATPDDASGTSGGAGSDEDGLAADASLLTDEFTFLDEDTYRVDTLGTPLSIVVDRPLFVQPNADGVFVVTDPESVGPDDDDIVMMRASFLSDPARPNAGFPFADNTWPTDDVTGWVANLVDEVRATPPEPTELGGFPAVRFDIEVGEIECGRGPQECVGFASDQAYNTKYLNPGVQYRVWFVEQEDETPIVVVVASIGPRDPWFETAESVLDGVEFGRVRPSPITSVSAGPAELDLLGGIRIDFGVDATVVPGRSFVRLGSEALGASLITGPRDSDGDLLESTDDVLTRIRANEAVVTETESTTVGGLPARAFDVAAPDPAGPVLFFGETNRRNWFVPTLGTVWLIEHPDRGVLMFTAESFLDVAELHDTIRDRVSTALSTVSFIETN